MIDCIHWPEIIISGETMRGIFLFILFSVIFLAAGCTGSIPAADISGKTGALETSPVPETVQDGLPPFEVYDLCVYGTEPEGISAALAGARRGLKVLITSPACEVGGLFTLGELNFFDMNHSRKGTLLTRGIFKEFYDLVGGTSFDISHAASVFRRLLTKEDNITLLLGHKLSNAIMNDDKLTGLLLDYEGNIKNIYAKVFIDASADADLAAISGAAHTTAPDDSSMGVTLIFTLEGLNWRAVSRYLKNDGDPHSDYSKRSAWGYKAEGFGYKAQDPGIMLRGFNISRQRNGDAVINSLIIFGVDVFDPESRKNAITRAQKELEYIVPYLNETCPGFESAILKSTARELYIRESRHMITEYILTIDDVLENRDQWDRIAIGGYPVDVQPSISNPYGNIIGSPDQYAIPFRCLVPLGVENLMVVGKSAGFSPLAAGSARVVPVGMATAEAAGAAARVIIDNCLTPRQLAYDTKLIATLQADLKARGAYLTMRAIKMPAVMEHFAYDAVRTLRALGMLAGGYSNDYQLDIEVSTQRAANLINRVLEKTGSLKEKTIIADPPVNSSVIIQTARIFTDEISDYEQAKAVLREKNILTPMLEPYFEDAQRTGNAAEITYLAANLYLYLTSQSD